MQSIIQSLRLIILVLILGVLFSCKKDDSSKPTNPVNTTVTDIDGNTYNTVTIGNQVWMKENLKVSKYRNGDPIPTNLSDTVWSATTTGACAINNNDAGNNTPYGKLYNFYAVSDPRGLCPAGWHVPSDWEWSNLENYLGGDSVAGGKLKSTSSLWTSPNLGATNESGFSGLPGGGRYDFGNYFLVGYSGNWCSSSEYSASLAHPRILAYNFDFSYRSAFSKQFGFSVRCLKY
jgi:uncharacterized protein (TIGR02145 family)